MIHVEIKKTLFLGSSVGWAIKS